MYKYEELKPRLFTEEGQRMFLSIRDGTHALIKKSGAVTMGKAMSCGKGGGDSWDMLACVDRLVELKEIREIYQAKCSGQDRVFVAVRRD